MRLFRLGQPATATLHRVLELLEGAEQLVNLCLEFARILVALVDQFATIVTYSLHPRLVVVHFRFQTLKNTII